MVKPHLMPNTPWGLRIWGLNQRPNVDKYRRSDKFETKWFDVEQQHIPHNVFEKLEGIQDEDRTV